MLNYVFRRLIIAIFLLIGIGVVSFIVIKLPPGDFASRYQQYLVDRGTPYDEAVTVRPDCCASSTVWTNP